MIAISLFSIPVLGADWWTHNTENFENDTAGADPTGFYTYLDTAWDYVFVNDTDCRSSNHSYEINDTDGVGHHTWFNWTADSHDYFELYFKIDNSTHDEINFYIGHTAGIGNEVKILGKQTVEPYVIYSNYTTEGWNRTISNNTWWRIRWDFNYTSNEIQCRLYNNASAEQTSGNNTWLLADPEVGALNIADTSGLGILGASGKSVQIWFDDIQLSELQESTHLRDNDNLSAQQVLLVIFLGIVVCLVFLYEGMRLMNGDIKDYKELVSAVVMVMILIVIMSFI